MDEVGQKYTILVVDDNPANLDILCALLKPTYRVKVAIGGEQALKLVSRKSPDLILLDVIMPGVDGYEVCSRLKADPNTSEIPIILVTANDPDIINDKGLDIIGCICKPVTTKSLELMLMKCFPE